VSDARPVGYRLHEYEPAAQLEAVASPCSVLGELLWHNILYPDVQLANSHKPEESGAEAVAHGRRTRIVVPTAEALS